MSHGLSRCREDHAGFIPNVNSPTYIWVVIKHHLPTSDYLFLYAAELDRSDIPSGVGSKIAKMLIHFFVPIGGTGTRGMPVHLLGVELVPVSRFEASR